MRLRLSALRGSSRRPRRFKILLLREKTDEGVEFSLRRAIRHHHVNKTIQ